MEEGEEEEKRDLGADPSFGHTNVLLSRACRPACRRERRQWAACADAPDQPSVFKTSGWAKGAPAALAVARCWAAAVPSQPTIRYGSVVAQANCLWLSSLGC